MSKSVNDHKFQILLAEDDEVNQDIVRAFLAEERQLELTVTSDGKEALEAAMTKRFDLMIFDQNMPFITGDRVIRHLRAGRSVNATTPAIRFTADADPKPLQIKTTDGISGATLPKPLSKTALVSTIHALLRLKYPCLETDTA